MKKLIVLFLLFSNYAIAQTATPRQSFFPKGTALYGDINYAGDTLKNHLLDIYLPPVVKSKYPLIVWIHGGGWRMNDKYADMGYMTETLKGFIDKGYAVASINYRWSTQAAFPAQIQDCNQALEFLYQNASKYKLDKDKIALIGFSAGGHLASLMGLSGNDNVAAFYPAGKKSHFKIKLVLDFYGPSDFLSLAGPDQKDAQHAISLLLGASVFDRPDLGKIASPVTYIDKNDPPFLIVQGEKDEAVNPLQSISLSLHLKLAGVKNEFIIVPNAPHFGVMFDAEDIRNKVFAWLDEYLK
ncbi:alpha/beta hydrolase [Mucilaginibacter ginsenosidivorax]|uniref:Alpha/beta hydrolase n=1 Tax=Mucilaginibacter ginsenosidivorax TaxID=862126 RepID=A0A5B8W5U3_9SPHI|nr:alpha/beta hydrolase [Mucilaginibacter ginsenosidivorax]QEC79173.1 alpha/beta hydrolase [Mucilaginibacter ginsenosidivorax]